MNALDIEKMTVHERLRAIEVLWDSLSHNQRQELESPAWHREVLEVRMQKIRDNEAEYLTLDELAARKHE